MKVSKDIRENEEELRKRLENCADIIVRPMMLGRDGGVRALVVYIEVAVSNMMLEDSVVGKLVNHLWMVPDEELVAFVSRNGFGISDTAEFTELDQALKAMLAGNAIFFLDGYEKAIKVGSKGYPNMGVTKAESEKVLHGSKEGFADSVKTNTALIRKRIRSTDLKVEEVRVGKRSDTVVALVYMDGLLYPRLLEQLKTRLEAYEIDGIWDSGMVEQLTEENWLSPFPQFESTERPDLAAMEILNGRLVLISDNSPFALMLPTTFGSFFKVSEDRYHRFLLASFTRAVRYAAMFLALLISGAYLAVICFHTQILPTNLLLSFAEARKGVPFPSMLEILLMELAFELIREAGVRMPGPLSGTIGIVGGLIIGDAAVSANLVSPMAVVVVALSALASFAVPGEEFQAAFRLLKFGFIFLGGLGGIFGITLGLFLLAGHLSALTSFQIPYLMPFVGQGLSGYEDERDSIFRAPFRRMNRRAVFSRREERVRLRKR
ncbi:MAG: spore germination protein [Lachnospiraceae bacterium]|nr:spore germination protein [Lachnospiraceae bacterium]